MIKKKFGTRVRELRLDSNLSQEKFALLIDMDRTYLASVENGKRNISLEISLKLRMDLISQSKNFLKACK